MSQNENFVKIDAARIRKAAHDARNPLTSISCFAELLLESDGVAGEVREYAEFIFSETQRLTTMLEEFFAELLPGEGAKN